jgi:hypothetical protein
MPTARQLVAQASSIEQHIKQDAHGSTGEKLALTELDLSSAQKRWTTRHVVSQDFWYFSSSAA